MNEQPFKPLLPVTSILLQDRHLHSRPSEEFSELKEEIQEWCEFTLTKGWRFFHLCCTMPSKIPGASHPNTTYDVVFPVLEVINKNDVIAFKLRWGDL